MFKAVATIRTVTLLLTGMLAAPAYASYASDITFTMTGSSPYCGSTLATVTYDGTGTIFNAGNLFTVQLSDASGSFAAPVLLATVSSTSATGEINVTFPAGASGAGYRIRIVSTNPSITGSDNGSDITIIPASSPSISITADPSTKVGAGSVIYFTSNVTEGGTSPEIEWTKNGDVVGTGHSYVLASAGEGDEVFATITLDAACTVPPSATSNTIAVDVDVNLTKSNNSWQERKGQPNGPGFFERSNASGFVLSTGTSDRIFIGLGSIPTDQYRKDFWEYDPQADVWTQRMTFPGSGRYNAVGFSIGAKGYVGLGHTAAGVAADLYEYEPTSNSWSARTSFAGGAREQVFSFVINGKAYVGGGSSTGDFEDVYEYNPAGSGSWTSKANFGGGKRMGAAAFSIGTKGYVAGGYSSSSNTYFKDLWEFDGTTWTELESMPGSERTCATAFALDGNGYVGMGYSALGYEGQLYQYDVEDDSWKQRPYYPGPTTLTRGVGVVANDRAYVYKDGTMIEYNLFSAEAFASKICSTEKIPVTYDASGFEFVADNVFKAQVSASPDFLVATMLATKVSSSSSGTLEATFPANAEGVYYFRIAAFDPPASNPYMWTPYAKITVTKVAAAHTIKSEDGATVCKDVPVTFTSTITVPGLQWYRNGEPVGTDNKIYIDSFLSDGDIIKAVCTYVTGCSAPVGVNSNTIVMTVRTPDKPVITIEQPNQLKSTPATRYQWYNNGEEIYNATDQSYQMTETGLYKVRTSDNGGCMAFSEELADAFTGLEDNSYDHTVLAYPVPFRDDVFLSLDDDILARGCGFTIMDELGQTVASNLRAEKINRLDLSGRAPGLYILKISFGQHNVVRKLVKID